MEQTAEVAESSWQLATNPTQDACDLLALCHLRMHTLMRGGPVAPHTTAFQGLLCWDSNPHGTPGRHARGGVVVQSSHNVQGAALGRGGDQATWTKDLAQLAVLCAAYPKQGSAPLAAQRVLGQQCVQLSHSNHHSRRAHQRVLPGRVEVDGHVPGAVEIVCGSTEDGSLLAS